MKPNGWPEQLIVPLFYNGLYRALGGYKRVDRELHTTLQLNTECCLVLSRSRYHRMLNKSSRKVKFL